MNFARFDLVKGKKKKKKRENKTNFPSFDREMEKRGTEKGRESMESRETKMINIVSSNGDGFPFSSGRKKRKISLER